MAARQLHIDQLEEFYLRDDLSRLTPGTRILFGHVRSVDVERVSTATGPAEAWCEVATVYAVGEYSHYDLHPPRQGVRKDSSSSLAEKTMRIRYIPGEAIREDYIADRHAADAGVLAYAPGHYNGANFTVLLNDLEAAGVELIPTPSSEYLEKQQVFNALYEETYGAIDRYIEAAIAEDIYSR
jgi:hypothetical protein